MLEWVKDLHFWCNTNNISFKKINWDNLIFRRIDPILGNIYNSTATKPSETYQRIYPSAGLIYTYNLKIQRTSKHDYLNLV